MMKLPRSSIIGPKSSTMVMVKESVAVDDDGLDETSDVCIKGMVNAYIPQVSTKVVCVQRLTKVE